MRQYSPPPLLDSPDQVITVAGVGGDYSTITEALAAAVSGDVVVVYPGTYAENITIPSGVRVRGYPLAQQVIIAGTHTVIDRLRLGGHWCRWWGVGQAGAVDHWVARQLGPAYALPGEAPDWMRIWLSVRADNAMHRLIETGALILALWRCS